MNFTTPQKPKKNIRVESRNNGETLYFTSNIGSVRIAIGNWHDDFVERELTNMIYLFRIDINEKFRGQRKCKDLLTECLNEIKIV